MLTLQNPHNITCTLVATGVILHNLDVNTTKPCNITRTLVATGVILRSLECTPAPHKTDHCQLILLLDFIRLFVHLFVCLFVSFLPSVRPPASRQNFLLLAAHGTRQLLQLHRHCHCATTSHHSFAVESEARERDMEEEEESRYGCRRQHNLGTVNLTS